MEINTDAYRKEWGKASMKYHLYDDYYLYNGVILKYSIIPSGNWYSEQLTPLNKTLAEFRAETSAGAEARFHAVRKILNHE